MSRRKAKEMRAYWNDRAKENAPWYVDTSLQYDEPDMEQFFADGRRIVDYAFDDPAFSVSNSHFALEIGCGLGRVCQALSDRFAHVLGVDIAPDMAAQARRLVTEPRVSFAIGDGVTLALVKSASVDAVFSFTVFQHIPSIKVIELYIEDAGRVLVPGGMFVFQWNNSGGTFWWSVRRRLIGFLRRMGLARDARERNAASFLGSRVSVRRVRAALERGGMELRDVQNTGNLYAFAWAVRR